MRTPIMDLPTRRPVSPASADADTVISCAKKQSADELRRELKFEYIKLALEDGIKCDVAFFEKVDGLFAGMQ